MITTNILILFILFITLLSFVRIHRLQREGEAHKAELNTANFLIRQGELQAELLKDRIEEIHIIRHDISHHHRVLLGLCESGDYGKMAQYLKDLDLTEVTKSLPVYSRNHVANIFIGYYKNMADSQGISFHFQADLPDEVPKNGSHLGILLGNAFQNALEAASQVTDGIRLIDVRIKYTDHKLLLLMENTFHGELLKIRDGYKTTKKTKGHGIGLSSIRQIVTLYDGYMQILNHENLFTLKVILYMNE